MRADARSLGPLRSRIGGWWLMPACMSPARCLSTKHPLNTLKLPLHCAAFPQAKVLFACRDPRDWF